MSNDPRPLRLAFAGTPEFALPALQHLAVSQQVCAVFTQPDRPAGRGRSARASAVKNRALELGLVVHQPPTFKAAEVPELLRSLRLDAMVVVAYGLILPAGVLGIPRLGCLNIHASLLPRWRGAAPIQRAILAGDLRTGITIMRLEPGLDTGPTLARRETDIAAGDTAQSLHDRLAIIGAELIDGVLRSLDAGAVREVPQPEEGVTYAEKIHKGEARIDWGGDAAQIWRQVRAFNSWPVAETQLNGAQLRIWEAEIAPASPEAPPGTILATTADGIDVACGRGTLRVLRLQLAGRKPLAAREFLKAQPLTGERFGL